MVTSRPSTTESQNQAKVQRKALLGKIFFYRMVFNLKLLKCGTSQLPYLDFPICRLLSREVPKLYPT